ncbi:MAG TPA: GntG family PLP-dependent aldolase [Chitinophagaceae bacterium]|nr:GntG family PLP-dependent aldolase [Chitinophagaceae bacterium]
MIDLRSDTLTRPTPGMKNAMMEAEVGDDVFGEDPSINALEKMAAGIFGREAALFCPSGTMTNQIAIKVHTQPGDEVVCSDMAHVYIYEGGGMAFNSGCQARPIPGDLGRITAAQIEQVINPPDDHKARTTLVCLENTSNRGGGSCYDLQEIIRIGALCQQKGIHLHLDGARLFNALVATGQTASQYGGLFDTISLCLSKGLGCPVGSVLIGDRDMIGEARRIRKKFGGGMRQAGFLAAAGIYALNHHVDRLLQDHEHARQIAASLTKKSFIRNLLPVQTNILIFSVTGSWNPKTFAEKLKGEGIIVMPISPTQVRMVTHLDISPKMVDQVCTSIEAMKD